MQIGEFDLPDEIIDRRVTKMKMISPSNREVDVGRTLNDKEYIGMCRREVFDDYLRNRAKKLGANVSRMLAPWSRSRARTDGSLTPMASDRTDRQRPDDVDGVPRG